jgi:hypothetical protein
MNQKPRGGTELQLEYLYRHVDNKLLDGVQITTSVPEKIPLSKDKPNILWQKNSWDQPNIYPWFKNKDNYKNMIGMYSIVIGTLNNLQNILIYQLRNV